MLGLEEFSRFVSQIHTSSAQPGAWESALAELTGHLDATACTIALGSGHERSILATSINAEAVAAYVNYYHQLDFVMEACESGPVGSVRGGHFASHRHTEYYNDWQQPFNMTDGLFVRLGASSLSSFIVSAPVRDEPFASAERVRFVNALVPHLERALSIREKVLDAHGQLPDISAVTDAVSHGIIVVADGGRLIRMNSAAEQVVSQRDGLVLRGDRLEACAVPANDELQSGIAKALVRRSHSMRMGSHLVCQRTTGKRPYVISVVPLDTDDDPRLARAAIIVIDPERALTPPKELLRKLFALTNSECEVALRMLRGDEPKTIADDTVVSIATIRTHINRIFRKTGTHRQPELIRLLVAIVP